MTLPPVFASAQEHRSRLADVDFWSPYVAEILARHDLTGPTRLPVAGVNTTYPTFLCDDVVVKLFNDSRSAKASHAAERAAHRLVASDPAIAAPTLLGEGYLQDRIGASWPYLITTRMSGIPSAGAHLSQDQRFELAVALGDQVRRLWALPADALFTVGDWSPLPVSTAAAHSSLPDHLMAQIDGYVDRFGPQEPVAVHGDLVANHVFVNGGRFTGIIDWGDALSFDRHYELVHLRFDVFGGDRRLLRAFLESSRWPVDSSFTHRALAMALHRQAVGLAQHHEIDVFAGLTGRAAGPAATSAGRAPTLDCLADELFGT